MLATKQINRTIVKLSHFSERLEDMIFQKVDEIPMKWLPNVERIHQIPDSHLFTTCETGEKWGGEGMFCWFLGSYTPRSSLAGKRLYFYPKSSANEGMYFVNGEAKGIFTKKDPVDHSRGNHYAGLLTASADPGRPLDIALELYAGHPCIGTQPFSNETKEYIFSVGPADICVRDEEIVDFLFDLKVVLEMADALDEKSFRRSDALYALMKIFDVLFLDQEYVKDESFREGIRAASPILKEFLSRENGPSAPYAGLIGHSHMDTAWLWEIDETVKKCARTYSNQLSLMEQYPEYMFIQSSAYHSEMVRLYYPELFERIKQKIAEGRYEPNGGVWVECDCNIVAGESLVRQFLWGQQYTREHFGYTADAFWLPDTFGYSAAIPQIMKLCGIKYFLTTKMSWNDLNAFPYDTFLWKGIDGTEVLTHLNRTHIGPSPKTLLEYVETGRKTGDSIKERTVAKGRLISFGQGDGGGGPTFEMLEMAHRLGNVEGLPLANYTSVSGFMQKLEQELREPSVYAGELYLELHRGTLTNQHEIKRNMRKAEIALHDLEFAIVREAIEKDEPLSGDKIRPLINTMLVNQFHDILPGTCIPPVHEQSRMEMREVIETAHSMVNDILTNENEEFVTITNTLSFSRNDIIYIDATGIDAPGTVQQRVDTLDGPRLAVAGIIQEPFASMALKKAESIDQSESAFVYDENVLETPHARITFNENGEMISFIDKNAADREICGEGYPLNTFLIAEDIPCAWDNWDIDPDIERKLKPNAKLIQREVVADGAVEFRMRCKYRLSERSTLTQDIVFYAANPLVCFQTIIDWHDGHRFIKAAFDTSVHATEARHEIQFGHILRPTHRSTDIEKAKYEVSQQKYTDLSETRYGVSILNDCKYGISVFNGQMRLSLHKGGLRPDDAGDFGQHRCTYAFLPHACGFSAESVVQPAYMLNYKPLLTGGCNAKKSLLFCDASTVLVETVKPCEKNQKGFIVRLYECEGTRAVATITVPGAWRIAETNILEEPLTEQPCEGESIKLTMKPFEIKTLLIEIQKF